jgi:uncharacterized protein YcnI
MALPLTSPARFAARSATVLVVAAVATVFAVLGELPQADPAAARVSIVPGAVKGGGTETFAVRLANERQDTSTNRLELAFPDDYPVSILAVTSVKGWTARVSTRRLREVEGQAVRTVATSIVWEGGRVGPGQFEQFLVTLGRLPRDGRLALTATQTYTNGDTEQWPGPSASGRSDAAPAITIGAGTVTTPPATTSQPTAAVTAPDGRADATDQDDSTRRTSEPGGQSGDDELTLVLALVVAFIGMLFGIAVVRRSRTPGPAPSVDDATDDAANNADVPPEATPPDDLATTAAMTETQPTKTQPTKATTP